MEGGPEAVGYIGMNIYLASVSFTDNHLGPLPDELSSCLPLHS
jgi:hypothetical protein